MVAVGDGQAFDPTTGMPTGWVASGATWWTWSREWLALKWPHWAGHSRRTAVETLVAIAPHMTVINPPKPPDDLGHVLRSEGYLPRNAEHSIPWLERWSVPLGDITPELLERTLTAVSTKADGANMSAPVARRRRNTLNTILRAAVRRGHLDINPMDRTEWRTPTRDASVDVSTVPSFAEVCDVVRVAANRKGIASRYAALFALVGMAGLRPSEGVGLRWNDLNLPDSGWGLARVGGAVTSPGSSLD